MASTNIHFHSTAPLPTVSAHISPKRIGDVDIEGTAWAGLLFLAADGSRADVSVFAETREATQAWMRGVRDAIDAALAADAAAHLEAAAAETAPAADNVVALAGLEADEVRRFARELVEKLAEEDIDLVDVFVEAVPARLREMEAEAVRG